jgi:glycosyltransferase involved in cell wall biosynthesis
VRIVQLVENLEVGGLERMAADLALALRSAGHEVSMYCLFGAGPLAKGLEAGGVPVVEIHKEQRSKIATVRAMAEQLRRDRAQVIHGHNPAVHHFAAAAKWAVGVPVCLNTRHSATSSTGAPYQERYFRWASRFTDHVVFDCDFVRRALEPRLRYPEAKYSTILNGIRLERFLDHPASPGSAEARLRFGTVGRLVPAKGHAVLIEAFAKLAPRLPEATLQIFGYGALESELRAQIERLGMRGRITLEGRTNDSARVFQALDVFVFSSLNEGLPLVILEAMAAGLPVVSTRVGGVPEVAPESLFPWFCEPGSVEGLADAMLRAGKSADLAEIGKRGREIAAANYGLDQMRRKYEGLYERLLS